MFTRTFEQDISPWTLVASESGIYLVRPGIKSVTVLILGVPKQNMADNTARKKHIPEQMLVLSNCWQKYCWERLALMRQQRFVWDVEIFWGQRQVLNSKPMLHGSENVNRRRVKIVDRSVLRASSWDGIGIGIGQPGSPLGRKRTLAQFCSGTDFQSSVINLPPLKEDWTDWKQKSGNKSVSVFDSNKIFINICPHPDIGNP